ncbi:MAG TPA: enoyl-CoA hydratase/isomerase family protein [Candidatus Binataceae bacterium]|nr:enoyl-CoA hydratase/isomerase family protein [Candidatus Binataceae bacterium]
MAIELSPINPASDLVAAAVHEPLGPLAYLRFVENGGVATLTINRPAVHNAVSLATMAEIERVLDWLEADASVAVLILTGAGDRSFVSGGDLKDFERITTYEAAVAMSRRMQLITARLRALPVAVLGAINGDCLGGGCEVALACDIRIVSDRAHFGFKQVNLGITPAWGGRRRFVRLVGRARALTLLLTGELIDAAEAGRIGLADQVVASAQVLATAEQLARTIASNPRMAVRAIKRMVNEDAAADDEQARAFEADLFAQTWISEDHQEALDARKERREPRFKGR